MVVFELARQLGDELLKTEEGANLRQKKAVFDSNEEAQKLLFEYTQYRQSIQERIQNGEMTEDEFRAEQVKVDEQITELKKNPIIDDMVKAETEFGTLFNRVMAILKSTIDGEDENDGCGGNCGGGCSGCH